MKKPENECNWAAKVLRHERRLMALKALPATLAWHAVLFDCFPDLILTRADAQATTNPRHRDVDVATSLSPRPCCNVDVAMLMLQRQSRGVDIAMSKSWRQHCDVAVAMRKL